MQAPMTIKQYVSQMRKIPGGRFTMGRTYFINDPEGYFKDEVPSHPVDMSPFRMGSTPVTVSMWREYVRANLATSMPEPPGWDWIDTHPMVKISWLDVMGRDAVSGYCAWASRVSGVQLILPTEAQWEYAAKGGRDDKYPWGNVFDTKLNWCITENYLQSQTAEVVRTNRIFSNGYGLTDMIGNVAQWCLDSYGPYLQAKRDRLGYSISSLDPNVQVRGNLVRCVRGSSWFYVGAEYGRIARRGKRNSDFAMNDTGFRLVAPAKSL